MKRCTFVVLILLIGAMPSVLARADQPAVPRIGALVLPRSTGAFETGLREGLRDLGYIEGKSIIIDWRRAGGKENDVQRLAIELARSNVDVIVVYGTPAARAALQVNKTTPIVFGSGDPVAAGLVTSLARPGGNATGVSAVITELIAKRMELLRDVAPQARRIGCLINLSDPLGVQQLEATQKAAAALGVQLLTLDARTQPQLDGVLGGLSRNTMSAVIVTADLLFEANKSKIANAVRRARLPATFPFRDYHDDGALMSYGPDVKAVARELAGYVDKILKGAKPGDLPIEQISKYQLVIGLRVADELNIKVPQDLLLRADEVMR